MKLTWFGHAAFGIDTHGTRVLTDPYSSKIGFAPINEAFDVVTLSHSNPDYHSCLDEVLGAPQVLQGLEIARSGHEQVLARGAVRVGAVEVAGDEAGGDPNAMVWLESDGVRVLHMGDCGHTPTAAQTAACGRVDVLLALAGGAPTLSIPTLLDFISALHPALVLPMHYGAPGLKTMALAPIEELEHDFKARFGSDRARRAATAVVDLQALEPASAPMLLIVPPAR
jgi:L-ascorbate metabolism protein UlaG (beta-lactamase superfamily)